MHMLRKFMADPKIHKTQYPDYHATKNNPKFDGRDLILKFHANEPLGVIIFLWSPYLVKCFHTF